MGSIQTGSSKVFADAKPVARVGDIIIVSAAEVAAAIGSRLSKPSPPKNTGVGPGTGALPPSAGGAGGSYEPALDYDGNLQPGVPGAVTISLDASTNDDGSAPKYNNLQDYINTTGSAGLLTGCEVTQSGNTVTVAAGSVLLRTDSSIPSAVKFFDTKETTLVANTESNIIVSLVGGAAVVSLSLDPADGMTSFALGSVMFINGSMVVKNDPTKVSDGVAGIINRFVEVSGIERGTGLDLSGTAGRYLQLAGGSVWSKLNRIEVPSFDSTSGGLVQVTYDGSALQYTNVAQWDNTQYNTFLGTATLGSGKYGVRWVYLHPDFGTLLVVTGSAENATEADATVEQPPGFLSDEFLASTILVGRIIFQKSGEATSINSAFLKSFPTKGGSSNVAATISVGTTTTGAPGSNATVSNSGNTTVAVFDFTIPQGAVGNTGPQGPIGNTGATGLAATIAVGTVLTGVPGTSASVNNSGNSSAATFNFTIPRGDTGATGAPGAAATISVGTVTTGTPGSNVIITNTGNSSVANLNFTIPQGASGSWGGITGNIAAQTDLITLIGSKSDNTAVVHLTGNELIANTKTFANTILNTAIDQQYLMTGGANANSTNRNTGLIHNKSSGDLGIYDVLNSSWLLRIDANNNVYSNGGITAAGVTLLSGGNLTLNAGNVIASNGYLAAQTTSTTNTLSLTDTGSSGCNIKLAGNGATTPKKWIRAQGGNLEFINDAYSSVIATLQDNGTFSVTGSMSANGEIYTGYSTGTAGSFSCNNWYRSYGGTGWYDQINAGGIYMTDTTYVRTYNGKSMYAADFVASSDARWKKNVVPFQEGNKYILSDNAVRYDWIASGKHDIGFIAQTILPHYPELVDEIAHEVWDEEAQMMVPHPTETRYTLNYQKAVAVLAGELKSVRNELEELKTLVEKLYVKN